MRLRIAGALVLAAGVAACSSASQTTNIRCPEVAVLADAASITRFAPGAGRDLVDVDHEATIFDITSGCEYEGRPGDADHRLHVALAPSIAVTRGPANRDRQARFSYFVSVVDETGAVRNKQEFPVAVEFVDNRSRVTFRDDDPPIGITLSAAPRDAPQASRIFVGFQLTPDELRFNRRDRERR